MMESYEKLTEAEIVVALGKLVLQNEEFKAGFRLIDVLLADGLVRLKSAEETIEELRETVKNQADKIALLEARTAVPEDFGL